MYTLPKGKFTKDQFDAAMSHAIALELTTIPCYLSTYYSINRAQDQDTLYQKILAQIKDEKLAKELTLDVLVYANKSAAIIMSVVIEEMLHLSLSSNIKQASSTSPDLMAAGKALNYPATLFADSSEFKINRAPLSLDQLIVLLQIESPNKFEEDPTIGIFYDKIIDYIRTTDINWRKTKDGFPQLVPNQPYYSQNSINTVYYDRKHNPQFPNDDDSGGTIEVLDRGSAITAINEIIDQGEGYKGGDTLNFTGSVNDPNKRPVPLKVVDGKVVYKAEDYDDESEQELSHFAKFLELYSLGCYYDEKFKDINGLDDFFSYFVYNQATNPYTSDYPKTNTFGAPQVPYLQSQIANAIYTYILLMIETCYHQEVPTQYEVFMMGIHKSMIWLLSQFGGDMRKQNYNKDAVSYAASVTFEYYPFENNKKQSPKAQIIALAKALVSADSSYAWLFDDPQYLLALPDVGLDHKVNKIPFTTPK